jgi:hypothetical protein
MQCYDDIFGKRDKNTSLFARTSIQSLSLPAIRRLKILLGCALLRSEHVVLYFESKTILIYVTYEILTVVTVTTVLGT